MFIGHLICLTYCMKFVASSQAFFLSCEVLGDVFNLCPKKSKKSLARWHSWKDMDDSIKK